MTISINFDCENFSASKNDTGSITIHAELLSLEDSHGLMLAIIKHVGIEHASKVMESEWTDHLKQSPQLPLLPDPEELIHYVIPPMKVIETQVPEAALNAYKLGIRQGVPTQLGKHDKIGYFVLHATGQGPVIVYHEK